MFLVLLYFVIKSEKCGEKHGVTQKERQRQKNQGDLDFGFQSRFITDYVTSSKRISRISKKDQR